MPLSSGSGAWEAFKQVHPPAPEKPIRQWVHPGWDWIYVIAGRMRLLIGKEERIVAAGDAVEFDTRRVPAGLAGSLWMAKIASMSSGIGRRAAAARSAVLPCDGFDQACGDRGHSSRTYSAGPMSGGSSTCSSSTL
ncbi:cupin domain-containing protein [Nonomuraea wenchangensis]